MTTPLLPVALPMRVTWELDGIRFNDRDRFGCEWVVDSEAGWSGSAPPRTSRQARVDTHGTYRLPAYRQARTVSLSGICAAPSERARRQAEHRIAGICADPERLYALRCREETGTLTAWVELDDEVMVTTRGPRWFEWSIQLAAPDPRKYADEVATMRTGLASQGADGLDFQQVIAPSTHAGLWFGYGSPDDGLMFGQSNASGFMTLTNRGSAPTYPVVRIYGPLTHPTLTTERGSLRYNDTLAAGEVVVIDPSVPSVLLGGSATRRHLLNPAAFDALEIPPATSAGAPGTLSIGLSHTDVWTAAGWVEVEYRAAFF